MLHTPSQLDDSRDVAVVRTSWNTYLINDSLSEAEEEVGFASFLAHRLRTIGADDGRIGLRALLQRAIRLSTLTSDGTFNFNLPTPTELKTEQLQRGKPHHINHPLIRSDQ